MLALKPLWRSLLSLNALLLPSALLKCNKDTCDCVDLLLQQRGVHNSGKILLSTRRKPTKYFCVLTDNNLQKDQTQMVDSTQVLLERATKYFRKKGYKVTKDAVIEGNSGISRRFDLLIAKSNEQNVVKVLNWNRTVGINVIINLDKASDDVGLRKPFSVSGKFSSHAKAYANRRGITLLTKRELGKY